MAENVMERLLKVYRQHRRPMIAAGVLIFVGWLLYVAGIESYRDRSFFQRIFELLNPRTIGMAMMGIGTGILYLYMFRATLRVRSKSFSDIDEERKIKEEPLGRTDSRQLIAELHSLRNSTSIDYGKIEEIIKRTKVQTDRPNPPPTSFEEYFNKVIASLSSRAFDSDEKASILLERGISYVRFGMIFYFCAIIVWQTCVHFLGFKQEFVYGMVTTSLLFLFIEFLSAWFLKQYQHFVDTATYLLKVKAIFDRYYLTYLALKGSEQHIAGDEKKLRTLTAALSEDIKWPSDNNLTKADVAFAREALDSVSGLLKAWKSNRREKKAEE